MFAPPISVTFELISTGADSLRAFHSSLQLLPSGQRDMRWFCVSSKQTNSRKGLGNFCVLLAIAMLKSEVVLGSCGDYLSHANPDSHDYWMQPEKPFSDAPELDSHSSDVLTLAPLPGRDHSPRRPVCNGPQCRRHTPTPVTPTPAANHLDGHEAALLANHPLLAEVTFTSFWRTFVERESTGAASGIFRPPCLAWTL